MNLESFGYRHYIRVFSQPENISSDQIARVIRQDKDRYIVFHPCGYLEGIPTGNLLFASSQKESLPVVGDWVAVTLMEMGSDEQIGQAVIHRVLKRINWLERKSAGRPTEKQLLAANLDEAIIMQSAGHDLNPNRLERHLAALSNQDIFPVAVINKMDLLKPQERESLEQSMKRRFPQLRVFYMSCTDGAGLDAFREHLEPSRTYGFIGSSGVGKSTLLNLLLGEKIQKTQAISGQTSKGKHTTTRRELFPLPNGALVIDTPGMREFGLTGDSHTESAFPGIERLAEQCQFDDCRHEHEPGCAVRKAVEEGEIGRERYENYRKLRREQEHYARSEAEKRHKDKEFGKMQKKVKHLRKRWKG